jgi:hypothetical protein
MRIEITDREHWLERVNAAISVIEAERKKRDMEYVDEWRTSVFVGRLLLMLNPDAKPTHDIHYPSLYGWNNYGTLLDMRAGLLSMGTGVIFFGTEEIKAAPALKEKYPSIQGNICAHTHCELNQI